MSEMVERVALAISGGDDPANILDIHRHRARAAIEAMRKPTKAMLAGAGAVRGGNIEASWRDMIEEALNDHLPRRARQRTSR